MKMVLGLIGAVFPLMLVCTSGCSPRKAAQSSKTAGPTDECRFMEEVCAEAVRFQTEFERLPPEEQEDMIGVLNTYTQHCEEARRSCEGSK